MQIFNFDTEIHKDQRRAEELKKYFWLSLYFGLSTDTDYTRQENKFT